MRRTVYDLAHARKNFDMLKAARFERFVNFFYPFDACARNRDDRFVAVGTSQNFCDVGNRTEHRNAVKLLPDERFVVVEKGCDFAEYFFALDVRSDGNACKSRADYVQMLVGSVHGFSL